MMKLVRVDDICNLCTFYFHGECMIEDIEDCECLVRSMEIVDAEPVKHGRWFKGIDGVYHCTRCGLEPLCWDDGTEALSRHCPHCGTLMDGGNDE